jgi:Xaa-Pro aminopeptidase
MDDLVRFHMEPCGESGHWCELTVTLAFRELSESEERLMATELDAKEAVRKAARPGVTLGSLARCYEEALRAANYEFGEETTHFDFHGQGLDVIEAPWFAAAQPWGSTGDAELQSGAILSYHPRRNVFPGVAWSTGISDDLLITDTGSEWLSGDWEHSWWRR